MSTREAVAIVQAAQGRGMTIVSIAKRLRVHKNTVHTWLRGQGSSVSGAVEHQLRLLDRANHRYEESEA